MAKWLVKSEPSECGIDDFVQRGDKPVPWDGVRNYQARNFLNQMAVGDEVYLYHSSCKDIGIAGVIRVVASAYADPAQFDPASPYFDAASAADNPRWQAVDMVFVRKLPRLIPLAELKSLAGLEGLALLQRGSRLSVMPVSEEHWRIIAGQSK